MFMYWGKSNDNNNNIIYYRSDDSMKYNMNMDLCASLTQISLIHDSNYSNNGYGSNNKYTVL